MPIFVGGSEIKDIKIGNTEINDVYVGGNHVWTRGLLSLSMTTGGYYDNDEDDDGDTYIEHRIGYEGGNYGHGSLSSTSFAAIISGTTIRELQWERENNLRYFQLRLERSSSIPNSGWTSMTLNGHTFNRTSASTYAQAYGGKQYRYYSWGNVWTGYPDRPIENNTTYTVVFN